MSDYPRMLYREGTETRVWDKYDCDLLTVSDEAEHEVARDQGWSDTPGEAHGETTKAAPKGDTKELQARLTAAEAKLAEAEELMKAALEENDTLKARAIDAETKVAELTATISKFDGDKDGKPGGSAKKA